MKHLVRLTRPFDASHQYGDGDCKELHGHSWQLSVVFELESPSDINRWGSGERLLDALVKEIDNRHLNDQIPASTPSPPGVAAWAFERLDMVLPGLVKTECEMAFGHTVGICER